MSILISFIFLSIGLVGLIWGADKFISNSSILARKIGISDLIIGLTLIALGTSAPEIFVSISSVLNDTPEIALGNSIGSNISNIGLIFGLSCFALASKAIPLDLRNIFLFILCTLIAGYCLFDLRLSIGDGILCICLIILFILNLLRSEEADIEVSNQDSGLMKVIFFTTLSLLVLIIGSELTVTGAESIAIYFGLSEVIIGLSIIAVGTSLPELAATVAAIRQDKSLIVIGNVLGSNFLNIVVVFPIIAFGSNEVFDGVIFTRDFLIMSVFSALFILALVVGRQKDGLSRILFYGFGLIFILGYLIYLFNLFI